MTMNLKKECEICGKTFIAKPHKANKYCSLACYHVAQKQGKYLWQTDRFKANHSYKCAFCSKEVHASKSHKRNGDIADNIFCNRDCYDKYRRLNTDRKCKYCGEHFIAIGAKKKAQFCNDDCRRKYTAQSCFKPCVICGQWFFPWTVARTRNNAVILANEVMTCSEECNKVYREMQEIKRRKQISKAITGSNHPNWAGGRNRYRGENWAHQRYLARLRDNNTCRYCGKTKKELSKKTYMKLEVHHIIPFKYFDNNYIKANAISNLVTLCTSCHHKAEWEFKRSLHYEN